MIIKIILKNFYFLWKKALFCFKFWYSARSVEEMRKLRAKANARGREITVEKLAYLIWSGSQIFSLRVAAAAFISVAARTVIFLRVPFSVYTSVFLFSWWSTWSKSLRRFFSWTSHWNSGGKNCGSSPIDERRNRD